MKYWQRNGGFKFWPEVKITRLIDIFRTVFSKQFFSLEADIVKSDYPIAPKFWQWIDYRINNKIMPANFFSRNVFSLRVIFVQTLHIFLILFRKRFITFHCN